MYGAMCSRLNGRRHGDLQKPARLGVAAADEILRLLAQAEDVDDALEVAGARLGQREVAGRALEKTGAEPLLELADALRHDGGRKAHLTPRGRHVAGASDACKYVEITDGSHLSPRYGDKSATGRIPLAVLRSKATKIDGRHDMLSAVLYFHIAEIRTPC